MPFKSKAQQAFMFAKHPEIAKEFAAKTNFSKLPEKKKKRVDKIVQKIKKDHGY